MILCNYEILNFYTCKSVSMNITSTITTRTDYEYTSIFGVDENEVSQSWLESRNNPKIYTEYNEVRS